MGFGVTSCHKAVITRSSSGKVRCGSTTSGTNQSEQPTLSVLVPSRNGIVFQRVSPAVCGPRAYDVGRALFCPSAAHTDETPSAPGSSPEPRPPASGRPGLLSLAVRFVLHVPRLNGLCTGAKQVDDLCKLNLLQTAGWKRVTSPTNDLMAQETDSVGMRKLA